MNVKLQYSVDFLAGIYFENRLQLNQYTVNLNLLTCTTEHVRTNIAMDRIKVFVYGELENTVFINQQQQEQAEMLWMLGCNVTTLPEDPVDQIVGMMLFHKLNAVTEGNLVITSLDIQSQLGDSVWYTHDEDDTSGPFAESGWWHESNCRHHDLDKTLADNVVKVPLNDWNEYNLSWPEDVNPTANTVVFANFPKHEN